MHYSLYSLSFVAPEMLRVIGMMNRIYLYITNQQIIYRLSRKLPPGKTPVYLFQLRHDVEVHNSEQLLCMEGECSKFIV